MSRWFVFFFCSLFSYLAAVPPTPLQNYFPVVVVNRTGIDSSKVYFLTNTTDMNGVPCFLQPNAMGIAQYVYPTASGLPGSVSASVALSSLPAATNTGFTDPAFLIYMPYGGSGRSYFSINYPLYLQTPGDGNGLISISPPALNLKDPNWYTLYQTYEMNGVFTSSINQQMQLFANLSSVDYFCLPMQLYFASYPSNAVILIPGTPAQTKTSGFCTGLTRKSIITTVNPLLTPANTWGALPVPYYTDPYTDSTPADYLRILAAKNSETFGTAGAAAQFQGANVPQGYFPSTYFSNAATGPGGISFMNTVYNFFTTNTFYIEIVPKGNPTAVYAVTAMGTMDPNFTLVLTAVSGGGPATFTTPLSQVSAVQLLAGAATWPFTPSGGNNDNYTAEFAKLFSALFTIGKFPPIGITTSAGMPFVNTNTGSFTAITYFTNPFSGTGPWYNLYDSVLHPLEILPNGSNPFTCGNTLTPPPINAGLGFGYAYDFDDLLDIDGSCSINYQDNFGNPDLQTGQSQPYVVVILESLAGTTIPAINQDSYAYPVTVGATVGQTAVSFTYFNGSSTVMTPASSTMNTNLGTVHVDPTHPFQVTFSFNSVNYTYNINLLRQVVTPTTGSYSSVDAQFMNGIVFNVATPQTNPTFTISFNSTYPQWSGP